MGEWVARGAVAVEMEAATSSRWRRGGAWRRRACSAVTDVAGEEGGLRAEPEQLEAIGLRVGEAGYAAVELQRLRSPAARG